jgi:hypothetical protein
MPLLDLCLPVAADALPHDVRTFLQEADRRIERFQRDHVLPAFVPSDFTRTYDALRTLAAQDLASGNLFCEWGSGFGVVACLASMLDFDACGIEIEGELVDEARQLAADFDLPVEFVCGSFIPPGGSGCLDNEGGFAWLTAEADGAHEEMGYDPDDFDVIFAYPWPDEEHAVVTLFERYAGPRTLLLTYHADNEMRLRHKAPFCRASQKRARSRRGTERGLRKRN